MTLEEKLDKLQVTIPEDLKRQIKAYCALEGITISELSREIFEKFLAEIQSKSGLSTAK